MQWRNVYASYIHLEETKNDESRDIPLDDTVKLEISELKKKYGKNIADDDFVFQKEDGNRYKQIRTSFFTARKNSGIKATIKFYDLRHTFASHLVMVGVDIITVKELLGHKSLVMTERYSQISIQHKQSAVDALNNKIKGVKNTGEVDTHMDTPEYKSLFGDGNVFITH